MGSARLLLSRSRASQEHKRGYKKASCSCGIALHFPADIERPSATESLKQWTSMVVTAQAKALELSRPWALSIQTQPRLNLKHQCWLDASSWAPFDHIKYICREGGQQRIQSLLAFNEHPSHPLMHERLDMKYIVIGSPQRSFLLPIHLAKKFLLVVKLYKKS